MTNLQYRVRPVPVKVSLLKEIFVFFLSGYPDKEWIVETPIKTLEPKGWAWREAARFSNKPDAMAWTYRELYRKKEAEEDELWEKENLEESLKEAVIIND